MHAFIDEGDYSNMTIDKALRLLLQDFKLPGEQSKSVCVGKTFGLSAQFPWVVS